MRSTSGSQNLAVVQERHDHSLFFSKLTKIKAMLKFPWALLIVKLSIPGLI